MVECLSCCSDCPSVVPPAVDSVANCCNEGTLRVKTMRTTMTKRRSEEVEAKRTKGKHPYRREDHSNNQKPQNGRSVPTSSSSSLTSLLHCGFVVRIYSSRTTLGFRNEI